MNRRQKRILHVLTGAALSAAAMSACGQMAAAGVEAASAKLPHYTAHHQVVPRSAEYVLSDGSIYIAGNDLVEPLMERIDEIYSAAHPGFKFKLDLISSGVAVAGISSGKSALGPTGRDVTPFEKEAFSSRFGYEVTDVLVGWDNNPDADHYPPFGKFPPGV